MECKNLDVNGKVERTTKDYDSGAKIIVRERRCRKCKQIHKTTEYTQNELYRKVVKQKEFEDKLMSEINSLKSKLANWDKIMWIFKTGIENIN